MAGSSPKFPGSSTAISATSNVSGLRSEVKRDADGVMRYRCGDYWLFSRQARSDQLTQAWPQIHAALASRVTR